MKKLLRHQFTFYESFYDALRDLPDEQLGRLFRGMAEFALYGDEPSYSDPTDKMAWKLIKPVLLKGRNKARDQENHNSSANEPQNGRKSNESPLIEGDIDGDIDGDIEVDRETTTKDSSCSNSAASGNDNDNYEKFKNWYNNEIQNTQLPKISIMTQQRKDALDAAKAAVGGEKIAKALARAKESDYLMGWKEEGRKMSVEWFLNPNNICKILEGYYDN